MNETSNDPGNRATARPREGGGGATKKEKKSTKKKRSPPPPPTSCDIEREEHMAKQKVGKRKRRKWELHAQYQVLYLCNVIHLSYAMVSLIAWGIPHPI